MAKSGSSSRFVSVNLNKSYGQPASLSTGHGGSSASASSSSGLSRPRLPNSHGSMVLLSRSSGRSQPSVSSAASASSRVSKLAVPRPVNLPSLRREHAGNDPTIALVGASGLSGWTKQQVLALPGDSVAGPPAVPVDSAAVRSASMIPESSWAPPVSHGRVTPSLADVENMERRLPSYQASTGRSSVYTPPGLRNTSAVNPVLAQYPPSEKAVIVRGDDFPTLQAAARPPVVPAPQRQRDMQQKQRDKQHELKDQHMKLQQLSQQQDSREDVSHLEYHYGLQLQPAQPARPQVRSKQPSNVEGRSYETRGVTDKVGSHFFGPSPLIRLTHTSNWADDERETLQSVRPQGMAQSDRLESGRPRYGYQFSDSWALNHSGAADSGRPTLRNGSLSGFGRDSRDQREYEKNVSYGFEGRVNGGFSNGVAKGFYSDQLEVGSRDDIGSWGRGVVRNDLPKGEWSSVARESNHNRDARLGNSSRSFSNRNNGLERDMNARTYRDTDPTLRGDSLGWGMLTREVRSRDGSFRKDAFFSKRGLDDWQGDRPRKGSGGQQFGRSDATSTSRTHAGVRSDLSGLDYGREKRANAFNGQDPFLEDTMISKARSFFGSEAFVGMSGLEAKIPRRKKDELKNYRDPARELFEAELERVQKTQEQERQRIVEERERAIELARKEEEERERLAREEELLRFKIEEETRETAAQAQREVEEAARKAEELRRAREEEKHRAILEEERRKDAARRKLLELEERIAKRESVQNMGSFERARRTEDMDTENEDRLMPSFGKAERNDEHAPFRVALPVQSLARREPVETPSSRPRLSESALRRSPDTRGGEMASVERNRVVQMKKRETLDDGPGLPLIPTKSHPRDDLPQLERELESFRESKLGAPRSSPSGASRSSSSTYTQERVQAERSTRKEQQWPSGLNEGFSGRHFSSDIDAGYMDYGNERDADVWWGRDNGRRLQEGQRLTSPPLPFYLNGGEADYPSFGRLRQSLPKQPRVPPPVFGRATLRRQTVQPEDTQAVPSADRNDNSEGSHKISTNSSSQGAAFEADIAEKVDTVDRLPSDAQMSENLESDAFNEISVLPNGELQVFDNTVEDGSANGSQTCPEQGLHPNEIDAVSELTESAERLEEDETQMAVDMQETSAEEPIGDDEDWLVQAKAEDTGEEVCVRDCLQLQNEVAIDELEDQEWESAKDEGDGQEHVNVTEEVDEANWESQQMEEVGDGVIDDPDKPADSQWESNGAYTPESEQQAEAEVKDPALQDAIEDHVVQPLIQQNSLSSANAFDSVPVGQSEGLSHGQSLLQQFQQPFSFMAVPLPQSTTSNNVISHPSVLPSMHSPQTQQELPYHLQMGLLPGTPLMPNAIQIGSIQMPLHVHPQMPQLAHLHHQQLPVFQFGQICHSVPFSQPVPPMQPAVQIHHAIGQPLLPQHHQAESLTPVNGSHGLPKVDQVFKGVNETAAQSSNAFSAGFNPSVDRPVETDMPLGSGSSSGEQNDHNPVVVLAVKSTDVQTPLPVVEMGHKASSLAGADANIEANQGISAGRISGGRRRNNGPWSYGILGRGRGRLRAGKNHGFEGPYSVAEILPENGTEEVSRSRMFQRNFRRAEYKVRKPSAAFDRSPGVGMSQGKHLSPYTTDLNVSSRLEITERKPNEDAQEESRSYLYSRSTQNVEAVPGSHPTQAGSKSNQADGGQTEREKNGLTSSSQTKGIFKKYKPDDVGDAPLQTGVVFVFEQPGIEIQSDKDDFIEVRSKRQMLREQRELRDKAKSKEFKVKEQMARKQQKLSGKAVLHEEATLATSSKHGIERWPVPRAEMVNNEGRRAKQSPSAAFSSTLPQFCVTSTSIGTSASASCDDSQKISKVSKSGQGQSMSIATHIDSGKMHAYGHQYHSNAPDSTPNINAAWGVQRSSYEVVSLTQIQLEEAMKPSRFEGMSSQMAPNFERGPTVLEPGISLASGLALEKAPAPVKAPVSVPGPISSLLAGEKIQFGAVTSPTVISSDSHPPSPSFIGAIGSPLGFGADIANIPTHPSSRTRNFLRPDGNGAFTSNKISTTGEDDVQGQLVDPEAEAEAAASAVAVAAISNDETVGNHSDASTALGCGSPVGSFPSFANPSGVEVTRPVIIQTPTNSLGIDDSMAVALPADLSVETPAPLLQASLPSAPATSGLMLQSLPTGASPFPCLEMGTILGGPIFAFGPREDAPLTPLEPGLAALGAGGVAGWQQRHSGTSDSFYGAPPPFMGPAGLPSIQGHPHMLVYTNPFTPIGQFGQLGVSFMGTAYHPSGKQPDWTHTPLITSLPGALNQNGGDMNAGLPGMMAPQHSSGAPNPVQGISVAGCSMMPVAAPISLFDPNLSAPFQAQWSRAPAPPLPNYPLSVPAPGLNLQPRNSSAVPGELGLLSQSMHMSNGFHQLPVTSSPFLSGDVAAAAVQFPDELGLGYSVSSSNPLLNDVEGSSNRGHISSPASAEVSGSKSQQGRRISHSGRGNLNLATASSRKEPFLGTQDARGSQLEASHLQIWNHDHQQGASGHHPNSPPSMDQRASQQALTRGSLGADWSGSNQRKGAPRTVTVDRGSVGERGSASSSKLKQIYVAKPAASTRNLDAA